MNDIQVDPARVQRGYAQRLAEVTEQLILTQAAASQLADELSEEQATVASLRAEINPLRERIQELEGAAVAEAQAKAGEARDRKR